MSATKIREESIPYKHEQGDLYRMSVSRYHEVTKSGLFDEDDQIELLQGFLVNKMTINPAHRSATGKLFRKLLKVLPETYFAES